MLLKVLQVLIMLEFLTFFDPGLNIKDTESAIKNNLKKLLSKLREFKFVATLVLVLKKTESENKIKYDKSIKNSQ